ncbi:MAG: hypothetical protein N2507_03270 [Candidatus Bipolaricaulota bacterium]|nr:hypothetical protein [Candidatus Bipolaricaulota bacterium]
MRAIDLLAERPYVLEAERSLPPHERTVFWIKGLPYDLYLKVQSAVSPTIRVPGRFMGRAAANLDEAMIELQPGARQQLEFEILSAGLVRVENLLGPDGQPITYPGPQAPEAVKKEWFARWLPPAVRTELVNAITEGSTFTEEMAKN